MPTNTGLSPLSPTNYFTIINSTNVTTISDYVFEAAPFEKLCPTKDCVYDCQNLTRLFHPVLDGANAGAEVYKGLDANKSVTFFDICVNLKRATTETSQVLEEYFSRDQDDNVSQVTSQIAACFASTCDLTRVPSACQEACSFNNLLADPTMLYFNINLSDTGVLGCVNTLCNNSGVLPYADSEVFGIGVIISYGLQATLLYIVALYLIVETLWRSILKKSGRRWELQEASKKLLENFLVVQSCFGVSLGIATMCDHPWDINVLNDHALICVTIIGGFPPVFTLMFLHAHGVKTRYSTAMAIASWMLNTVPSFILYFNLDPFGDSTKVSVVAIQDLFSAETSCGGSSAMSLCQQLIGTEPISDLFSDQGPIPIASLALVLWVYTTVLLVCLVRLQVLQWSMKRNNKDKQRNEIRKQSRRIITLLSIAGVTYLFFLAMLLNAIIDYLSAGLINKKGWSFGQVVAVLVWLPVMIDGIHLFYKKYSCCGRKLELKDNESTQFLLGGLSASVKRHRTV